MQSKLVVAIALATALLMSAPGDGFAPSPAYAVEPDEVLDDPALEARARQLSAGLRCMVCQNQSIDDSNAGLAKDLRVLVRERLVAGDTNKEVIDYLVSRYGEFVLLQPRVSAGTVALWVTPIVVLFAGAGYAFVAMRRRRKDQPKTPTLSDEEQRELAKVLKNG
ncbi:cytochrome c-type biogenesis protein cycl precursor [Fulvimarina pelagi HTCC2506]|uniref:Cytochrome c-type biogenesis protein n=1 Tax=Fulvimarina pelagi HTCC2506 TaxID=314231 RepID=Q0FZ44_9HYPH|nr:cytochrome c-type biogenesis protein [Fulvimarina pelagi]EAU40114.1 cytochrome c-type biogenesis protein cycl precursor [Fulvimarina pelagi HTCC2506]